jgi:type VI secretion system protein ImpH
MAGPSREPSADLTRDLLRRGHEFSFRQALRLLGRSGGTLESDGASSETARRIRVRPELSLGFPPADIARVEELPGGTGHLVTATFLGLYGVASPLPTFYTEDLLSEVADEVTSTRDFLDILHARLYALLFRVFGKYRTLLRVLEEGDAGEQERLFCLIGLGEPALRENLPGAWTLLRYAGLLSQFPRSAAGLEAMLRDALGGIPVEAVPCLERMVKIPEDQRCVLGRSGNRLGDEAVVGEEIRDRGGKFRLRVGPVDIERFQTLMPGGADHGKLASLTRFYLDAPLEFDIELLLAREAVHTTRLGAPRWAGLGLDTWIFSTDQLEGDVRTVFPPDNPTGGVAA